MEVSSCPASLLTSCFYKDLKQQFPSDSQKWNILGFGSHYASLYLKGEGAKRSPGGENSERASELRPDP